MTERISVQAVKAIEGMLAELEAEKARVVDAYRQEQALVAGMKALNQERQAVAEAFRQLEAASEELKALGLLDAAQEVTEQASRACVSLGHVQSKESAKI